MSMRVPLKCLHWVMVGAVSVMKTEMGHIPMNTGENPHPAV